MTRSLDFESHTPPSISSILSPLGCLKFSPADLNQQKNFWGRKRISRLLPSPHSCWIQEALLTTGSMCAAFYETPPHSIGTHTLTKQCSSKGHLHNSSLRNDLLCFYWYNTQSQPETEECYKWHGTRSRSISNIRASYREPFFYCLGKSSELEALSTKKFPPLKTTFFILLFWYMPFQIMPWFSMTLMIENFHRHNIILQKPECGVNGVQGCSLLF